MKRSEEDFYVNGDACWGFKEDVSVWGRRHSPVMFAGPSSVTEKTMDVGVASPGGTHFFLVRWCFPGWPTNLMPFGTETLTWTCRSKRWWQRLQRRPRFSGRARWHHFSRKAHPSSSVLSSELWRRWRFFFFLKIALCEFSMLTDSYAQAPWRIRVPLIIQFSQRAQ